MNAAAALNSSRILDWAEMGLVPDGIIRFGIRRLLKDRLREISSLDCEWVAADQERFLKIMDAGPIAPLPELANEQHYEVPA